MIEAVVMLANGIAREAHRKIDTEDTKERACVLPKNVKRVGIAVFSICHCVNGLFDSEPDTVGIVAVNDSMKKTRSENSNESIPSTATVPS
jgi:hypothetical protein